MVSFLTSCLNLQTLSCLQKNHNFFFFHFGVLQYTEKEGLRLGLVGWVKNTRAGTVVGQVQGPAEQVDEM